jgi:hypothetical protein
MIIPIKNVLQSGKEMKSIGRRKEKKVKNKIGVSRYLCSIDKFQN